ncbi:hypothetical protein [Streptomyces sp. NRRL F-2664]|uniref:hypothetical protein n=1 Tax=Streptomyces sp. NRRL F-2664 TaxID=1463842 RepID=UPI0004C93A6F|nr:hypothetical protein [Streptomyces sp. NRRL F-2664]
MAGNGLTPHETAVWDQLLAELDSGRRSGRRTRRAVRRLAGAVLLLLAAALMLVGGSFSGSGFLAWSGVIVWVGVVLAISHHHGHGPRFPARPLPGRPVPPVHGAG